MNDAGLMRATITLTVVLSALASAATYLYARSGEGLRDRFTTTPKRVLEGKAWLADQSGDEDAAEQMYRELLRGRYGSDADNVVTLKRLGTLLWHQQKYEDAVPYLIQATAPEDSPVHFYLPLIDSLFQLGRLDPDFEIYLDRWELAAKDADAKDELARANYYRGKLSHARHDLLSAREYYESAQALHTGTKAGFELALMAMETADTIAAQEHLQAFLLGGAQGDDAAQARDLLRDLAN